MQHVGVQCARLETKRNGRVPNTTMASLSTMCLYHTTDDRVAMVLMDDADGTIRNQLVPVEWMPAVVAYFQPTNVVCVTSDVSRFAWLPCTAVFHAADPACVFPMRDVCRVLDMFRVNYKVHLNRSYRCVPCTFEEWMTWTDWTSGVVAAPHSTTCPCSSSVCTS